MWGRDRTRMAVLGVASVVFVVCCVLPVAYLWAVTIDDFGRVSGTFILDARQRGLLFNTAILGGGTMGLAAILGVPIGIALARVPLRHKPLIRIVAAAPILLPPWVMALAWIALGGSRGVVASLTGHDFLSAWIYSLPGAIVVLGLVLYPLSMLATEAALRRVDRRLEEAGLIYAPPARVMRHITLPLVAPGIVAAALVVFVLAVSEFGVPGLLQLRVYTTEVFTAFAALYDFSRATLLAAPLLLLCTLVAGSAALLFDRRIVAPRRSSGAAATISENWRGRGELAALLVITVAVVLPVLVLVRETSGTSALSVAIAGAGESIARSLILAAVGASATVALAVCLGVARERADGYIAHALPAVLVLLFATPATIVGVGLIWVWNRPGWLGEVYGTDAMFLLAYLARFVPVATLIVAATARAVPRSLEEAAAVGGSGWLRTVRTILLPQMRLGIATAWVVSFVLAFGELGVAILVAPPGRETLPIRVYTIMANAPPSHVAALALLQVFVILTPLAVFALAAARRGDQ